jgi:hypothetical protein
MKTDWKYMTFEHEAFCRECAACGLPAPRRIRNGEPLFDEVLTEKQQVLLEKIALAHGKPATDTALLDLRDCLGSDSAEWAAYREIVIEWIREKRAERYKAEADPLRYAALEKEKLGQDASGEWKVWLEKKNKIKEIFSYPE